MNPLEAEIIQEWHILVVVLGGIASFIFTMSKWRTQKDMQISDLRSNQEKIVARLDAILSKLQSISIVIAKIEVEQGHQDEQIAKLEKAINDGRNKK